MPSPPFPLPEALARRRRSEELVALLDEAMAVARDFLAREHAPGDAASRDPERLAARLDLALGERGLGTHAVLARLREVLAATPSTSSWRFVNQLFGGREPVATVAEMLAVLPNVSMYTFKAAGVQILIEQELLRHMAAVAGLHGAEGSFTPGGSLANLLALLLARNAADPAARDAGVSGARLTVYTSEEGHYSIPKGAGIVGFGRQQVRRVAVDTRGRMDPAALARALEIDRSEGFRPALVNATAGTTVRGAFDPIRPLALLAREHGAWLHVDGALGGSLVLSAERDPLLDGLELADSFAWNPHKMMGVPLQSSLLLVTRRGALNESLDESADYLFQAHDDELNPGHRSLQCGRRNDALRLWAAWLHLGDLGWAERIGRQLALARLAAERVAADPELVLAEPPPSINVCFEVRGRSSEAVCEALDRAGRLKIGHGAVRGRQVIRLVCVNPDLDSADLDALFAEIKSAARALPPGDNRIG